MSDDFESTEVSALGRIEQLGHAATGRLYRGWADARRRTRGAGSAQPAIDVVGGADRSDIDEWNRTTADHHDAYRESIEPSAGRVAIICSSNRPADMANVVASVGAQSHEDLEFVFVAHGDHWDIDAATQACAALDDRLHRVQVLHRPTSMSLGACLNAAMEASDARFVAKFDSDDHYGPKYLADALRAHRYAGAGVVGKQTYFGYLEATDQYLLRFPGREFCYSATLAGGSLVIDRHIVADQRFADLSIGEDQAFLRRCHRRGISVFAADRFNYTIVRSGLNTWKIPNDDFVVDSIVFDKGWDPSQIER